MSSIPLVNKEFHSLSNLDYFWEPILRRQIRHKENGSLWKEGLCRLLPPNHALIVQQQQPPPPNNNNENDDETLQTVIESLLPSKNIYNNNNNNRETHNNNHHPYVHINKFI